MGQFEDAPSTIGTYHSDLLGQFLREGLSERYPTTTVEVVSVVRDGHQVHDMIVKTDPLTAAEMSAFVAGSFRVYNNRHKLG